MTGESSRLKPKLLDAAVELMGQSGRRGTVHVQGQSMEPTLSSGQLLAVEFAPDRLRRGDMIVFRQVDYLVVHRLLGRVRRRGGEAYYRARGDGLTKLDPPIAPEKIVGRVIAFKDGARWRSTRGRAARRYGLLLAWHDLFWVGVSLLARLGEAVLRRLRVPIRLRPGVAAIDRWLLRRVHPLLFLRAHPVVSDEEVEDYREPAARPGA